MKKLLLLNPPFLPNYSRDSRSPAVTRSGTIYYPIWLSYAAGYLIRNKVNVKLIDAIAEPVPWKQFSKYLSDENYDIIAIHTSTPSIESDGKIAQDIKKILPTA
ncbi:cobalamin-dependent protein, partial [Candidatus Dependentiae bacterium]|nr:cobalamin-dependent protein [Candidatus Dependentiae bacterium]